VVEIRVPQRVPVGVSSTLVLTQFAGLLLDKLFGGLPPRSSPRWSAPPALVHLTILTLMLKFAGLRFEVAQAIATVVAMFNSSQQRHHLPRSAAPRVAAVARAALFILSAASVRCQYRHRQYSV
jgi:hypothetical protein